MGVIMDDIQHYGRLAKKQACACMGICTCIPSKLFHPANQPLALSEKSGLRYVCIFGKARSNAGCDLMMR